MRCLLLLLFKGEKAITWVILFHQKNLRSSCCNDAAAQRAAREAAERAKIQADNVRVWVDLGRVFQIQSWQVMSRRITWGLVLTNLGRSLLMMTYMSSTKRARCLAIVTDPILW